MAGELLFRATRLLIGSVCLQCYGLEELLAWKRRGRPVIFVGWHGQDFVNLGAFRPILGFDARAAIMVRDDPNGLVLGHFCRRMDISVASLGHDPESHQWAQGVVTMVKLIRAGCDGMVAVDGPEGPAYQVKPGAALMAQRSGAILVPVCAAASRAFRLRHRWDEQLIPLPLSRTAVHLGPVIDPCPPGEQKPTVEELQQRIAEALFAGTRRAEELCRGISRPKPPSL